MQTYARPVPTVPDLSVGHLFSRGWETFKANVGVSLGVTVLFMLLTNVGGVSRSGGSSVVLNLAGAIIAGPLAAGVNFFFLRLVRGEAAEFTSMFDGFRRFWKSLGVYWLMLLAIAVGLCLLVVPGVILALGLLPATYLVLDGDLGIVDTLKRAWEMTRGYKGQLFIVGLAVVGLNILGLLALIVGVFVTWTVSMAIFAAAYDELAGRERVPVAEAVVTSG